MTLAGAVSAHARQADAAGEQSRPKFTVQISTVSDESLRKPKSVYTAGENVFAQLDMTNTTAEDLSIVMGDPFRQLRLRLTRDGKKVEFSRETQARLDRKQERGPVFSSGMQVTLGPFSSKTMEVIDLGKWYGTLAPGSYELTVWRVWGKGHKSNTVSFEVVP